MCDSHGEERTVEKAIRQPWLSLESTRGHQSGHGVYTLMATERVREYRAQPASPSPRGLARFVDKLYEDYISGKLISSLPLTLQSLSTRQEMIREGHAIDLSIGASRVLRTRLMAYGRQRASGDRCLELLISETAKILRCRPLTSRDSHEHEDGIYHCRTRLCNHPVCVSSRRARRWETMSSAYRQMCELTEQYDLFMLTLTSSWPLPVGERRLAAEGPVITLRGRARPRLWRPSAPEECGEGSLLDERLTSHRQHLRRFLDAVGHGSLSALSPVPLVMCATEVSFTVPSQPGMRVFPSPHTHLVVPVAGSRDGEDVAHAVTRSWQEASNSPWSRVLVSKIEDRSLSSVPAYLSKGYTVTWDTADESERDHLAVVLDDRTLDETLSTANRRMRIIRALNKRGSGGRELL